MSKNGTDSIKVGANHQPPKQPLWLDLCEHQQEAMKGGSREYTGPTAVPWWIIMYPPGERPPDCPQG